MRSAVCEAVSKQVCADDPAAAAEYIWRLLGHRRSMMTPPHSSTSAAKPDTDASTAATKGPLIADARAAVVPPGQLGGHVDASLGSTADVWLSKAMPMLLSATSASEAYWQTAAAAASASDVLRQTLQAFEGHPFTRTLVSLLEVHCALSTGAGGDNEPLPFSEVAGAGASNGSPARHAATSFVEVHACLALQLAASMAHPATFMAFLPFWKRKTSASMAPPAALTATAAYLRKAVFNASTTAKYMDRRQSTEAVDAAIAARDEANERVVRRRQPARRVLERPPRATLNRNPNLNLDPIPSTLPSAGPRAHQPLCCAA